MKKLMLGAAGAALLLFSCTTNEVLDQEDPSGSGKIKFSALTNVTRAATHNPIVNTGGLQNHVNFFFLKGYLVGVTTPLVGSTTPKGVHWNGFSWEYSNEPYWPNGSMDFFAYANWPTSLGVTPVISATGITAADVTIGADALNVNGHYDLLVAATLGATKQTRTLINFKHALTQIVFMAGNVSDQTAGAADGLEVKIDDIEIVHVKSKGDLTFAKAPNQIVWTDLGTDATYLVQGIQNFVVPPVTNPTNYAGYTQVQSAPTTTSNALLLIPQTFAAWDPTGGKMANAANQTNAYIKLKAIIKKTGATDAAFYYCGAPGAPDTYGDMYIPVESVIGEVGLWEAGKRINYILTFGDKNSGSGGGGYDNNGDPILVPIRFNAVVEDWKEVNVPLLTAQFEATATQITPAFVEQYTAQMANDIAAAPAPKLYEAMIKINGPVLSSFSLITTSILNESSMFLPKSMITFNFSDATVDPYTITAPAIAGWTVVGSPLSTASSIAYIKVATTYSAYTTLPNYISDNLAAVRLNSVGNPLTSATNVVMTVNGALAANHNFMADDLSATNAATGAKVTINVTNLAMGGYSLSTVVPNGWSAAVGASNYLPGDPISISVNTNPIVFTKI